MLGHVQAVSALLQSQLAAERDSNKMLRQQADELALQLKVGAMTILPTGQQRTLLHPSVPVPALTSGASPRLHTRVR